VEKAPQYLAFDKSVPCSAAIQGAKPISNLDDILNIPEDKPILGKGEFETTEDFKKREAIEIQKEKDRVNGVIVSAGYGGFIKTELGADGVYDADKGIFSVKTSLNSQSTKLKVSQNDSSTFQNMLISVPKEISEYQTAGSTTIKYVTRKTPTILYVSEIPSGQAYPIKLQMPAEQAKDLKLNLSFVMVGKLIPPYRHRDDFSGTTLDGNPLRIEQHSATMKVTCAAIINKGTGTVIYEYK